MKRNVDLTQNRDFEKRQDINILLFPYNRVSALHKLLYKEYNKDEIPKDKWGIYQGKMVDRMSKKLYGEYTEGLTCERCGKHLYPYWSKTLCEKCDLDIERNLFERIFL